VAGWPVPVQTLAIVGHSMGGLVARSACHVAARRAWLAAAAAAAGLPGHAAPRRAAGARRPPGRRLLGISPYVAPFARLGKARSAGITDLRYGNVQRRRGAGA
jgi:alpha-beta hydrolase superfamily lysophospholipase